MIDGHITITGSFNFTKVAQIRNAENVVIIDDKDFAKIVMNNFNRRKAQSESLQTYCSYKRNC